MTNILIIAGAILVVVLLVAALIIRRRKPRSLKTPRFQDKWREMQKLCSDKACWAQAIIEADNILGEALKKKGFNGKTVGERLTKAQRLISDNEGVWFGHKLRSKLDTDPLTKLKEADVKQALLGIRRALKDLGALPNDK
jgi:hypothetical protein